MKGSITNIFFIVVGVLLSLALVQPAMPYEESITGVVIETLREESIIIIKPFDETKDPVLIKGFPYNFAERELEIELSLPEDNVAIENGDCVTIYYLVAEMGRAGELINKAVALIYYCGDCVESGECYEDPVGIIFLEKEDDEYSPVNKNPNYSNSHNWKNSGSQNPN